MKKVMLITSNVSPVPATRGGAVELLIQLLIEENEKRHQAEFFVVSTWDEKAEKISEKYKYTKILYYKNRKNLTLLQKIKSLPFDIKCSLLWLNEKVHGKGKTYRYHFWAYSQALKLQPDYVVAEAGLYEHFAIFLKHFRKDQMWAHLHRVVVGSEKEWSIFENAIGVSNYVSNKYKNGNDKIHTVTVYNCANEKALKEEPEPQMVKKITTDFAIKPDDFMITYTGRITWEKGVKELVEAVLSIPNKKIRLCILGASVYAGSADTDYVREIRDIAKNSDGRIILAGYVDNSLLNDYLSLSKLHVVPSIYEEPGALTPLEAMMAGVPVIISDSGGMAEYVEDAYPMLIHRGANMKDELCAWIQKCYEDEAFRIRCIEKGNKNALRFTCEKYYKNFLSVFS